MTSELELDYDGLCMELNEHIDKAILNLKAARAIAEKLGIGRLSEYDNWEDLREAIKDFFPVLRTYDSPGWSGSSWCEY